MQDFNAAVLHQATAPNVAANALRHGCQDWERRCQFISGDFESACALLAREPGFTPFDVILTSESIYNVTSAKQILAGCAICLSVTGVVLVASKSHYFGVGGGLCKFKQQVSEQNVFSCKIVRRIEDGGSNVREVLQLARLAS